MKYAEQGGKGALLCGAQWSQEHSVQRKQQKQNTIEDCLKDEMPRKDDGCQKHKQLLREVVFIGRQIR